MANNEYIYNNTNHASGWWNSVQTHGTADIRKGHYCLERQVGLASS
jgi:hypothetical protein